MPSSPRLAGAWEEFSVRDFARAVQFSLTGVGIDAVNRWRRAAPGLFDRPVKETLDGVRYEVDNALLNSIQTADQASARVFVKDRASTWMKFRFGEGHRAAGDVGIEAWFPNQDKVYIPVEDGLSRTQNIRPDAYGNYSGRAVKKLAGQLAAGYSRNTTGNSKWGVFEIKAGERDPAGLGVGIHARPARGTAVVHRERLKRKLKAGAAAPRTEFTAAGGEGRGRSSGREPGCDEALVPHARGRRRVQAVPLAILGRLHAAGGRDPA